jgi:hypothetical protein
MSSLRRQSNGGCDVDGIEFSRQSSVADIPYSCTYLPTYLPMLLCVFSLLLLLLLLLLRKLIVEELIAAVQTLCTSHFWDVT